MHDIILPTTAYIEQFQLSTSDLGVSPRDLGEIVTQILEVLLNDANNFKCHLAALPKYEMLCVPYTTYTDEQRHRMHSAVWGLGIGIYNELQAIGALFQDASGGPGLDYYFDHFVSKDILLRVFF